MAQLTREGRVLPEAAGGSPAGPHPDRGLGSLTSIWAPNHLFSCSPDPRQQPLCSGPWAGLSEAATAWLVFSDYLASAPGEQAGVCHTAGAHRNQWQSLHGKEGDPQVMLGRRLGWRASCLWLWGHPGELPVSPGGPAKAAAVSTPGRTPSAGMRLPCGQPPGLSPTDRARGCRSRTRQNQRACGSVLCPVLGRQVGSRPPLEGGEEKRCSHLSPVPVALLPKTALLEFSLR